MDEDESSQRVRIMAPWELGPPSLPQRVVKVHEYGQYETGIKSALRGGSGMACVPGCAMQAMSELAAGPDMS